MVRRGRRTGLATGYAILQKIVADDRCHRSNRQPTISRARYLSIDARAVHRHVLRQLILNQLRRRGEDDVVPLLQPANDAGEIAALQIAGALQNVERYRCLRRLRGRVHEIDARARAMFADGVWGMGALTKAEEGTILKLRDRVAPLWQHESLKPQRTSIIEPMKEPAVVSA